jgi:hypothetical protein
VTGHRSAIEALVVELAEKTHDVVAVAMDGARAALRDKILELGYVAAISGEGILRQPFLYPEIAKKCANLRFPFRSNKAGIRIS